MPRTQGRLSTLEVSTDGGTTWVALGCLGDIGFSISSEEIEVTCRDDGNTRAYLPGRIDGELTFDGQWVEEDAGQTSVVDAVFSQSEVDIRFRPYGAGSGLRQFVSKATITSLDIDSGLDDSVTFSGTLRLSGTFTAGFQP